MECTATIVDPGSRPQDLFAVRLRLGRLGNPLEYTGYTLVVLRETHQNTDIWEIFRHDHGDKSPVVRLGRAPAPNLRAGDKIRVTARGSTITAYVGRAGQNGWTQILNADDAACVRPGPLAWQMRFPGQLKLDDLRAGTLGASPVSVDVSALDAAAGRSWARLDPLALEESWMRLQALVAEPPPAS
jgi:hypothetical protein